MDVSTFLPMLLYIAGFVLLVVLIIIGIKIIGILDKVDRIVDNVEDKVNSFNTAITTLSKAANGFADISNSVVFGLTTAVSRIFNKKMKEEDN